MSTNSCALSAGNIFLGAPRGHPLKRSCFFGQSCSVELSVAPKLSAKRSSASSFRLVACHLGGSVDVAKKEIYNINILHAESELTRLGHAAETNARTRQAVLKPAVPKPRVILIAGPTAVGKTRLSIELAKAIGGEIINADSVQVYQGLDIGAAKATLEERQGVPHHLMDVVPPTEDYPYERFLADSRAAAQDILARGRVPIVIGGTGIYMRYFMHGRADLTSHPFEGEDLTGEFDSVADHWDYDFQSYFLYQHRADLFPRLDLRCEKQVLELLEETSALLDMGVQPHSNNAANAIGYEESIDLLLEARRSDGVVTEERFFEFLTLFQHNCRNLARKQTAWYRKTTRSEVRQFRWIKAGQPVEEMVEMLAQEYKRPVGMSSGVPAGLELMAASVKEQKRMQKYKPTMHVYSDSGAVEKVLQWIRSTQGSR